MLHTYTHPSTSALCKAQGSASVIFFCVCGHRFIYIFNRIQSAVLDWSNKKLDTTPALGLFRIEWIIYQRYMVYRWLSSNHQLSSSCWKRDDTVLALDKKEGRKRRKKRRNGCLDRTHLVSIYNRVPSLYLLCIIIFFNIWIQSKRKIEGFFIGWGGMTLEVNKMCVNKKRGQIYTTGCGLI